MSQLTPYLQNAIDIFKKYYANFIDNSFLEEERDYKLELSRLAQEKLSRTTMRELLQQGRANELMDTIRRIFTGNKNNLPSPQEKVIITNISGEKVERFVQALYIFLYQEVSWSERLAQFVDTFKDITGEKASWPQLTFFPFLLFPNEHLFLKPEAMSKAAQVLGYRWDYKPAPDLDTYTQFQQLGQHLLIVLHELGPRDMIDIQSFLWVVANAAPNYWRVIPGRQVQYWPQFREYKRIAAGWDDIGPLTQYDTQKMIKDALVVKRGQNDGSVSIIARQLNDLRNIQIGDRIFVYGDNSILGVGEITNGYEYIPGEWPPSSQDYNNHHQYQVQWLSLAQKSLKDLTEPLKKKIQTPPTILAVNQEEAHTILKKLYPELLNGEGNRIIDKLSTYLTAHGFHFPKDLLTTYYLSLQTKPFVILTGISGTGKTKLTQLFAEWMSPAVEERTVEVEVPEDGDNVFYLDVKPYYFKSGFVIPVKAYRYFNLPDVHNTTSIKVQLGKNDLLTEAKLRHQHHPQGNSYVYFYSNDVIKKWLKDNFSVGDFLAFRILEGGQKYRLEKFKPSEKQLIKQRPHHVFLSVRPDWTDNRGLLGFYNLITQTYQTTDFLRLLTQATIEPDAPYFVILDEMNLAKVEYYFADFLSILESRYIQNGEIKQETLRLHDLPRCVLAQGETTWDDEAELEEEVRGMCRVRCDGCPLRHGVDERYWAPGWASSSYAEAQQAGFKPERYIPPRLAVPVNIYFTGTVNVDETTYMFSPKVLDRANTIEFNEVNLTDYFNQMPNQLNSVPADGTIRQQFTLNGKFTQLPKSVPNLRTDPALVPYCQRLDDLNKTLAPYIMHFGYRVADEILLYLWHAHNLNIPDFNLDTAFDYQIYQKVLPKFHGSEAKLKEPLTKLQDFCQTYNYQCSFAKIKTMLDQLMKEGFASFA